MSYFLFNSKWFILFLNSIIDYILIILPVLLNVAFITLMERKILAYSQFRVGPNKVSMGGMLQPIADATKLFSNQFDSPFSSNFIMFFFSPSISVILVVIVWVVSPWLTGFHSFKYGVLVILLLLSLGVYPLLVAGWSSNSKYALLGGLRGVAQTISYEISLALVMLTILLYIGSFNLEEMVSLCKYSMMLIVIPFSCLVWVVSCIAETNRTPFDFSEGESELVSGFNIEYGSGGFALIFIAEYASIYFLSYLSIFLSTGSSPLCIENQFMVIYLVFFWVWARSTLPRFRYDLLMGLAWKDFLPFALGSLELSIFLLY